MGWMQWFNKMAFKIIRLISHTFDSLRKTKKGLCDKNLFCHGYENCNLTAISKTR